MRLPLSVLVHSYLIWPARTGFGYRRLSPVFDCILPASGSQECPLCIEDAHIVK